MNRSVKSALVAIGSLCAAASLILTIPTAQAKPRQTDQSARQIAQSVFKSSDPYQAFHSLSPQSRAVFVKSLSTQTSRTTVSTGGVYTPSAAQRKAMRTDAAPQILAGVTPNSSGCWYHYWKKAWYDLGLHDGDSWMQLNWCGSGGTITSWSQSNVGCAGHYGATCSVSYRANRNVGWEIRSTRYYNANFFGYGNTFCMQIRGGATGLYSTRSSSSANCPM